jgi:Ca2+/Na+ antiporter
MIENEKIFYKIQQFRQKWIWTILLIVLFVLFLPIISGVVSILLGVILILTGFCFIWLFYSMKLITEIKGDSIHIKFSPFTTQIIPFSEIIKYEIRQYRPIIEYGGWGIRFNRSGKAYTVSGNIGIQIQLSAGKGILIGTQQPNEFLQAMKLYDI